MDTIFTHHTAKTVTGRRYWRAAVLLPGCRCYTYVHIEKLTPSLYTYVVQNDGLHRTGRGTRREVIEQANEIVLSFAANNQEEA